MKKIKTEINGIEVEVDVEKDEARIENQNFKFEEDEEGLWIVLDNERYFVEDVIKLSEKDFRVHIQGYSFDVKVMDALSDVDEMEMTGDVTAPMAGVVTKILVKPSQKVKKGDHLLLLSAMKMENEIVAPVEGKVESIHCKENSQVNANELLIKISVD